MTVRPARRVLIPVVILALAGAGAAWAAQNSHRTLAAEARWLARHGGVRSSRYGDATPRLKELSRRLVVAQYRPAGPGAVRHALCIVRAESDFNPGARNQHSDATGLAQIEPHIWHYPLWMLLDPAWNVRAMWRISRHGRDWGPWRNPAYSC